MSKMKINIVRGTSEEEVKSKKFNIYVGISLGNRWFTKENIREHILFALKYTKSRAGILIADTLHAINYEVRNKQSPKNAIKRAIKKGKEMRFMIEEIISDLPKSQQKKIDIVVWKDVEADSSHMEIRKVLYEEFKKNPKFRKEILNMVEVFINRPNEKKFNKREIEKLAQYILDELPELLFGFYYKKIYYNTYTYPYDSLLTQFVEKLQKKKVFPEIHDKLKIKDNIIFIGLS